MRSALLLLLCVLLVGLAARGAALAKCTDGLLAMLGACAETVDGVVSPDGTSGCLPAAGAVSVGEALGTLFPR